MVTLLPFDHHAKLLKLRDTSPQKVTAANKQKTLRNCKAHRLTVCQKQLSGNTCGNAVYTIMAAGLHFGLAHFRISPAPQTGEIETSSTGGQHLLCREMQMETELSVKVHCRGLDRGLSIHWEKILPAVAMRE